MKTITIQLPKSHLDTYKQYSKRYNVNINELMDAQGFLQLQCINDDVFGSLESFESHSQINEELENVSLSYNEQSIIFIKRVAELLRRSPEEVMTNGLITGAICMESYMSEFEKDPTEEGSREVLESYPKDIIEQRKAAQLGSMIKCVHGFDCWGWFNIRNASSSVTEPTAA